MIRIEKKEKKANVKKIFNQVYEKYDFMNDLLSFGIHRFWKKNLLDCMFPRKKTKLLDVASGTGDIAKLFLKKINYQGKVFCVDNNKCMLDKSKKKFNNKKNIKWIVSDAESLPFKSEYFDYYTISFGIRNLSNIDKGLAEAYRVLKPGGRFMCLEFSKIEDKNLSKIYEIYSSIIPKLGQKIVGESEPYEYLVSSIKKFYSQIELKNKIEKQKFKKVKYYNLSGGIAAIHSAWKI